MSHYRLHNSHWLVWVAFKIREVNENSLLKCDLRNLLLLESLDAGVLGRILRVRSLPIMPISKCITVTDVYISIMKIRLNSSTPIILRLWVSVLNTDLHMHEWIVGFYCAPNLPGYEDAHLNDVQQLNLTAAWNVQLFSSQHCPHPSAESFHFVYYLSYTEIHFSLR